MYTCCNFVAEPPSKCNTETIIVSTVLTFLLTLILGMFIGAISISGWNKYSGRSNKATTQTYSDTTVPGPLVESNPSYNILNQRIQSPVDNQNQVSQRDSLIKQRIGVPCPGPLYEDPDALLQ